MNVLDTRTEVLEGVRTLPNGALQDVTTGKIIKSAPGQAWDSAKASEMAKKRWAKAQEETRDGIQRAVQEKNPSKALQDFPEAHGVVVETLMTDVVLNVGEKGKARADTYKMLLEMEGSVRTSKVLGEEGDRGMVISFSRDVAKYMMDRLVERKNQVSEVVIIEAGE